MTAVEWLFNELCSEKLSWNKDSNGKLFFDKTTSDILQQAKEMERQQIIDAHGVQTKKNAGISTYRLSGEKYYEQTFKQEP